METVVCSGAQPTCLPVLLKQRRAKIQEMESMGLRGHAARRVPSSVPIVANLKTSSIEQGVSGARDRAEGTVNCFYTTYSRWLLVNPHD